MSNNENKKSLSDLKAFREGELNETQENQLLEAYFVGEERLRLKAIAETHESVPLIPKPNPIIGFFRPMYARAAVLLLTAGVSYVSVTKYTKHIDDQEQQTVLAESNQARDGFEPIGQKLLGEPAAPVAWKELYEKKQYVAVVDLLDEATTDDGETFFYLGLSSFKKQPADYDKAIRCFLKAQKKDYHVTNAQWWLAMAYYQQGTLDACEAALLKIKPKQYKYAAAQQFLAQLKKKK